MCSPPLHKRRFCIMSAPRSMTRAEFARHIGKSKSYITALGKSGRLVLSESGRRVLVQETLALISDTQDPNRDDVRARWQQERGDGAADPKTPEDEAASESYQAARARKETALANRAEMEAAELAGRLVPLDEVARAGADAGAALRATLEGWPAQWAAQFATMTDADQIFAVLTDEVHALLTEFGRRVTAASAKYDRNQGH